ncbi:hypothetical protein D3C79_893840 [compost metagenome]
MPDSLEVVTRNCGKQCFEALLKHVPCQIILIGTHDHGVARSQNVFANQQLLVEFLSRAQARKLDGNIPVRIMLGADAEAREVDHFLSQLHDPHRLPHVQHENISALPHGTGLYHQLRSFGNGHEIAGDLGMGYGERATGLDLLVEQRNDRP